ncbi:MAG: glycoside hydrolase family 3 protein, partial [Rickettsiaceae bacterium]|nr:glycoside hydrolase family 3 protein [Rickettsiaceae bacterium]
GNHSKYAMTAHVLYEAIDSELPATLSKRVIDYIRQEIGFTGTLMGDDISMKALSGNIGELAVESLSAGCNLVLHCNGNMEEMKIIAEALHDFS